ncbi:MAG: LamG domain-containing protein [Planctomycetaceae bacterium]|nr:LamG domain-containing protein [Planctomycetaceae bacterium]
MVRPPDMDAEINATERLGGLLRSYRRAALFIRCSLGSPHSGPKTIREISAARSPVFESFFASGDLAGLNLDLESSHATKDFTRRNVRSSCLTPRDGNQNSLSRLFLNGELAGQIQQSLDVVWMQRNALNNEHDAAIFLGIHCVGSIDELRVYRRALSETTLKRLHQEAK